MRSTSHSSREKKELKKCAGVAEEGRKIASLTAVTPGEGSAEYGQPWGLVSCRIPNLGKLWSRDKSSNLSSALLAPWRGIAGTDSASGSWCLTSAPLQRYPSPPIWLNLATLPVLCGCLQPPSAHATPPCRSFINICSLHSCKRPSPWPTPAHTPVSRPRLGSHIQEIQRH